MKMLEKLQKRLQQGKKDNKGFSLVELIIVIAIMAILIGIVGMNVIPQIENARKATDAEVLSAMISEAMQAWTQVMNASDSASIEITVQSNGDLYFKPSTPTAFQKKFAELAGFDLDSSSTTKNTTRVLKSTTGKGLGTITITCNETNGVFIGTITGTTYTPPTGFEGYEFRSR